MPLQKPAPPDDQKVNFAQIDWVGEDALRSRIFDDIYFSNHDGLAESRHVFLTGNNLATRLANLSQPTNTFCVGELGFGTGLNLLALWHLWNQRSQEHAAPCGHLHMLSVEAYPLCPDDFSRAQSLIAKTWPELAPLTSKLQAHYPVTIPGHHTLHLAPNVTLTLIIGPAETALISAHAAVDAWFLDGFSPAKNPAIWSAPIMAQVARLSRPGASFSTFTVAGFVRQNLSAAGFTLAKRPGHGRKRSMLTGHLPTPMPSPPATSNPAPWYSPPPPIAKTSPRIIIAGAGIAGACLGWHCARAGYNVTLFDRDKPGAGASGNPAGLIMPRLDLGNTPEAPFYRLAWLDAVRFIQQLEKQAGMDIFISRGGLMLAATKEAALKHEKIIAANLLPQDQLHPITSTQARKLAGLPLSLSDTYQHLSLPTAGTVNPPQYLAALLQGLDLQQGELTTYTPANTHTPVHATFRTSYGEKKLECDALIIANGPDAAPFLPEATLIKSRGQIDPTSSPRPHMALSFGHYLAPLTANPNGPAITGATYNLHEGTASVRWSPASRNENFAALEGLLSDCPPDPTNTNTAPGRAALRCAPPDFHPLVGAMPDTDYYQQAYKGLKAGVRPPYPPAAYQSGLYLLTGLGSRGLVTAPICARLLLSLINKTPSPLAIKETNLLHPARFIIRKLRRG